MLNGKMISRELDPEELEPVYGGARWDETDPNMVVYLVYYPTERPNLFKTYEKALAFCVNAGLPESAIIKRVISTASGC